MSSLQVEEINCGTKFLQNDFLFSKQNIWLSNGHKKIFLLFQPTKPLNLHAIIGVSSFKQPDRAKIAIE